MKLTKIAFYSFIAAITTLLLAAAVHALVLKYDLKPDTKQPEIDLIYESLPQEEAYKAEITDRLANTTPYTIASVLYSLYVKYDKEVIKHMLKAHVAGDRLSILYNNEQKTEQFLLYYEHKTQTLIKICIDDMLNVDEIPVCIYYDEEKARVHKTISTNDELLSKAITTMIDIVNTYNILTQSNEETI